MENIRKKLPSELCNNEKTLWYGIEDNEELVANVQLLLNNEVKEIVEYILFPSDMKKIRALANEVTRRMPSGGLFATQAAKAEGVDAAIKEALRLIKEKVKSDFSGQMWAIDSEITWRKNDIGGSSD